MTFNTIKEEQEKKPGNNHERLIRLVDNTTLYIYSGM